MQPRRRRLSARDEQPGSAGVDRRSRLPNRIGRLQHRIQRSTAAVARPQRAGAGSRRSGQPERRRTKANTDGAHIVMIGILPTLMPEHLSGGWMSESTRYQALNDSIFTARGEDILIDIAGPERLSLQTASIAPESACTSMQLHLQVSPEDFAKNWNAAQVLAGPQLALGANSPYFFGHQLWSETRIELFAQATDTRPDELKAQGVRPAGLVRRALDHLDLRPVRGERPLLPVAATRAVGRGSGRRAGRRAHPAAAGAAAAQRHDLPVEPAGVRRRRRPAAPAGGEPRVACRADRRRHDGQLGVLLRHAARPVRGGPPVVDKDEFRCGTTEFPRRRPARDGGQAVLARHSAR